MASPRYNVGEDPTDGNEDYEKCESEYIKKTASAMEDIIKQEMLTHAFCSALPPGLKI